MIDTSLADSSYNIRRQRFFNKIVTILSYFIRPELAERIIHSKSTDFKNYRGLGYVKIWYYLWAMLFKKSFPIHQHNRKFLETYFPHINFNAPVLLDIIRIPLQLFWLSLVKPIDRNSENIHSYFKRRLKKKTSKPNLVRRALNWSRHRASEHTNIVARLFSRKAYYIWKNNKLARNLFTAVAIFIGVLCITVPFSVYAQLTFLLLLWMIALWLRSIPGQMPALIMIILSAIVSTRYLWWRMTATLNWDDTIDLVLGLGLLSAETYAWLILLLGYFQTILPLRRRPKGLPQDTSLWPTVDIYIPTYNEPLSVLKPTVYAAMSLDWPEDKINIYILDDGRREEFEKFAEQISCGYLTRPDNSYAKAGNLNHALKKTNGEFITIFDCDHIPTRSFLQTTMGWFLKDEKLALMQTPHHFFSPDPFEKNLDNFRDKPNEGELFYGLIQDGNDLWNATFFCGSCAVLRRKPLQEIGGVATETVTEDAHTALKMHRLGYRSAYINLPQAAGLATESLSEHIGQRIRWARGMAQIFRLDNPIIGKGLSIAQRICYGNAMLHFFNGLPRLVFMTAPLAFLLLHAYIIYAPAILIVLYVSQHMIHAALTNSRVQGKYRSSMWAEMYESVLSWYIIRPTIVALINPKKGKFNVTAKGGLVEDEYFDWIISKPYLIIVLLCITGFFVGIYRLFYGPVDEISTVIVNLVWISYNLVILGGAIAVATEGKQIRKAHRVDFDIPAFVQLDSGKLLNCQVKNYSETGLGVEIQAASILKEQQKALIILCRGSQEYCFPVKISVIFNNKVGLQFDHLTQQQEANLIQCTFARADAWEYWKDGREKDTPTKGIKEIISIGLDGYNRLFHHSAPFLDPVFRSFTYVLLKIIWLLPKTPDITNYYSKEFK